MPRTVQIKVPTITLKQAAASTDLIEMYKTHIHSIRIHPSPDTPGWYYVSFEFSTGKNMATYGTFGKPYACFKDLEVTRKAAKILQRRIGCGIDDELAHTHVEKVENKT